MRCNRNYSLTMLIFTILLMSGFARGDVFDVTNDYSSASASSLHGVWSFGWKLENSLGSSAINLFDQNANSTGAFTAFNFWQSQALGSLPLVGKYQSASNSALQNGTIFNANQLAMHAGTSGANVAVSVVRFTAPETGSYRLDQAVFEYRSDIPGNKVYIYLNGTNIFEQTLGARGSQASLGSQTIALNVGDNLDFMVGSRGGQINSTTTQLNAIITSVPEPSSATLVAMTGLAWAMLLARKRTR